MIRFIFYKKPEHEGDSMLISIIKDGLSTRGVAFEHEALKYVGQGKVVRMFDQYDLSSASAIIQLIKRIQPSHLEVYALTTVNSKNFSTFIDQISKELDEWIPIQSTQ